MQILESFVKQTLSITGNMRMLEMILDHTPVTRWTIDLEFSLCPQVISSYILLSTQMRLEVMVKVIVLPGVLMMNAIATFWPRGDT
jgi:hypothetical protein